MSDPITGAPYLHHPEVLRKILFVNYSGDKNQFMVELQKIVQNA